MVRISSFYHLLMEKTRFELWSDLFEQRTNVRKKYGSYAVRTGFAWSIFNRFSIDLANLAYVSDDRSRR